MAHKKIKIPTIAITPEAEEDDDHNYTTLADSLTDVETLELDNDSNIIHNVEKGRHKLIIKLADESGGVTDTENVDGSSDEIEFKVVAHEKPISIADLDLDPGTCKETHKVRSRGNKGRKKLHTQSSTVTEANEHLNLDFCVHSGTTDVEEYSASDDELPVKPLKESKNLFQMLETSINTKISDKFVPLNSSTTEAKKLTDVENIDSDLNSDKDQKMPKSKKVRRRRQKSKPSAYDTDEEDFQVCLNKTDKKLSDDSNASSSNEGGRYDIKFKNAGRPKALVVPQDNVDGNTDVEALDSNDENGLIDIPIAVVKRCKRGSSTEEEVLSDTNVSYRIESVPEVSIPKPFRKVVTLRKASSDRPIVTITPIGDDHVPGMHHYYQDATDEESFSDTEALLFAEALSRGATPDLSIFDEGFDNISESIRMRRRSLRNASSAFMEVLTDTEDLWIDVGKNKKTASSKYLSAVTISRSKRNSLTDTEDLFLSDRETRKRNNSDGGTDLESLGMSDDEYLNEKVDLLRALSTTPISMREMGGDTVLSKESSGPFSDLNRLYINRRVSMVKSAVASPIVTDTEELCTSDADDGFMIRMDPSKSVSLRKQLEEEISSQVFTQNTHNIDLEAPHEVMYLKGGSYREAHTDVEDVNASDDEEHACATKKKFSVDILSDNNVLVSMKKSCANMKDCTGPGRFRNGKEWDAVTEKPSADGPITSKGKLAVDGGKGEASSPSDFTLPRQPAPFRDVGEEGDSEVPIQGPSSHSSQRFVSDQHQLSEEMKQLLRDMEEESKK